MADTYRTRPYKPAAAIKKKRPAFRVRQTGDDLVAGTVHAAPANPAISPIASTPAVPAVRPSFVPQPEVEAPQVAGAPTKRPLRLWKWLLGAAAVVVLLYGARVAYSFWRFETQIYKPLPAPASNAVAAKPQATPAALAEPGPATSVAQVTSTPDAFSQLPPGRTNILIMGTDKRPNDPDHYARSDSMILLNLDAVDHKVRALSIPRDLVVSIPGYGQNKVNAAYLFGEYYKEPGGGPGLAVRTVSDFFGVPVDYYVSVNFDGFRKLIDTVGGIYIDVPYEIDDYHYPSDDEGDPFGELHVHFDAGLQHMDGKNALRYARTRHADNDFMRSKRQLQVMLATRRSATSVNLLPSLPSVIDQLAGMVETNIPFSKQAALAQLGYQLNASSIITSSIDAEMIMPATLPDGSEGLTLNMEKAQPMLDDFFGTSPAANAGDLQTESVTPTVTKAKVAAATATAVRKTVRTTVAGKRSTPTTTPQAEGGVRPVRPSSSTSNK